MWGVVEENKTTGAYRELAEEKVDVIGGCHMMAYKRLQVKKGSSCSLILMVFQSIVSPSVLACRWVLHP